MTEKNMTALVSLFARAYHYENSSTKILEDCVAKKLLTPKEYNEIAHHMTQGIGFFQPSFTGTEEEALQWVVNHNLAPSPLGRSAFAEKVLQNKVSMGARQYLIFGAGYDSFGYRQPTWGRGLEIFEIDQPHIIADKKQRLEHSEIAIPTNLHYISADLQEEAWIEKLTKSRSFSKEKISFFSLLGLVYYLPKEAFVQLLSTLRPLVPQGSAIVLDYPAEDDTKENSQNRETKLEELAKAANEPMVAKYTPKEMEKLLATQGFGIEQHLTPDKITETFFKKYNNDNPKCPIVAMDKVNYCLAVKE